MNRDVRMMIESPIPEKLMEKALNRGAVFSQVQRSSKRSIILSTDVRSSCILLALCRKYGLNCRILRRGGRAALADLIRARWTLAPALLLCVLLCALFLGRIWTLDIRFTGSCPELGNRNELLAQLKAEDIHAGMPASAVDTALLQKQLDAASGNYSFIGVRRQGIRLLVEASPEVPSPRLHALENARDLVAARNGVVEVVSVYSGEAAVNIGDTVMRGDLLIRGEETIGKDSETGEDIVRPVSAMGHITARSWFEGSAQAALFSPFSQPTGASRTECRLKLMDFSLPISECTPYPSEDVERKTLPVVGLFLPLEIERIVHRETQIQTRPTDPKELEQTLISLARADALQKISSNVNEYEIASEWTDAQIKEDTLHIRAVYEICTDIAVERDALIEEVY